MRLGFATEELVTYMVAGGALDRHPGLTMVVIEAGASWMAGLGERLDEVNEAHQYYVKPKLSRKPSEILYSQVKATFQFDRACLKTIDMTGHECLMWASDYPHMEGTFPHSQQVIEQVFAGIESAPRRESRHPGRHGGAPVRHRAAQAGRSEARRVSSTELTQETDMSAS